jgi:hypothetical protein
MRYLLQGLYQKSGENKCEQNASQANKQSNGKTIIPDFFYTSQNYAVRATHAQNQKTVMIIKNINSF